MNRRHREAAPTSPPADHIARLTADWRRERPDLDVDPVAIVNRVGRLAAYFATEIERTFNAAPISSADFAVLANLRRAGSPYRLTQRRLMDALGLTSGTVSLRIDRLEAERLVRRDADPTDGRIVQVSLTAEGEALFDTIAPQHLANEARLVAALTTDEQAALARLLQTLLVDYEPATPERPDRRLGLHLAAGHLTQRRRAAVGLAPMVGLLVEDVVSDGPASASGIQRGDLLTASGQRQLRSITCLAAAIAATRDGQLALVIQRGRRRIETTIPLDDVHWSDNPD